jgi:hypothetical protein
LIPDTTEAVVEEAVEPTKRLIRILYFFLSPALLGFHRCGVDGLRENWSELYRGGMDIL